MAKQTPQDQSKMPEAAIAEWLEARHDWIVRGDADTNVVAPKTESATHVPTGYENADRTLRALAHLRTLRNSNKWRPDALSENREASEVLVPNANGVTQLGRFVLRDEVGRGGFGLVYRAFDPELKREVALKIPRPEALFSEDRQRRFEDEARATARLRHPNICRVLEVGQEGAIRFLVCEFCDGPDLAQWLRARTEHVPLRFAAKLFVALASGVSHAHSRGVLHRDLKPSNILLEPDAPNADDRESIPFTPRIVDFGLAKLMEGSSGVTRTGDRLGTVDYMAPEQADGRVRDIGVATDVFALGVMLYEVLTARRPFAGASQGESLKNLLTSDPPRPRRLRHEIPEDLEAICLKCLEKDEAKRYGSADDLADDLRRYLAGEPTSARPLSRFQRLDRWTRRRPALAALYGVSLLAIVVLAAVGWSYNRRLASLFANEKSLRKQADESRDALAEQMRSNLERVYAIDMRSALEAMQNGHISAVRERLARYTPKPDQIDMRTTVWRMLSRFCDDTNEVLYQHHGPARHIAGPANGEWFATGGADGMIYVWDEQARSRRAIPESAAAHNGAINDLKVSHDGARLISCGEDGRVKIWRMPEGLLERVIPMEPNQSRERRSIAISRDGEILAIGDDRGVTLWATDEFNEVGKLPHPNGVGAIAISPDGTLLATACDDSRARVWNVTDRRLLHTLSHHYTKGTGVSEVAFAHNSRLLATAGSGDGAAHWFDALTGDQLGEIHYGDCAIHAIAFTPDDRAIVLSNAAGAIKQVALTEAEVRQLFTKDAVEILDVHVPPNSPFLVVTCNDGSVRRIASSRLQLTEHTSPALPYVMDARLTSNPSRLLTHISSGIVTLRDLRDGNPFFNIGATRADEILERLSISNRSGRFAFVLSIGRVDVRSLENETVFQTRELPQELLSAAISTDGQTIASGGRNGELTLWDVSSRNPRVAAQTDQGALSLIRFSNDDTRLVVVGQNDVTLRRGANLEVLERLKGVTNEMYTAVFLPDNETVATNDGKQIVLWNAATGMVRRLQGHADTVVCLDVSPDGSTLASGGRDGRLILWDVRTTERIGPLLDDAKVINSIDFSPDGKMLAAGVVTVKYRRDRPHFKLWAWGDRNVNDYAPYHSLLRMRAAWPPAGGMRRARPAGSSVAVYANDFDGNEKALDGVIAEWSGGAVVDCEGFAGAVEESNSEPRNERLSAKNTIEPTRRSASGNFLRSGEYDAVTLTLKNLPAHDSVDLDFILAIIDSWDGLRDDYTAPDLFSVYVDDAPIFREGLSSVAQPATEQVYLPPVEAVLAPRGEKNFGFAPHPDALYDMSMESRFGAIPHTADTLVIEWRAEGAGIQSIDDESWAIENVRVQLNSSQVTE